MKKTVFAIILSIAMIMTVIPVMAEPNQITVLVKDPDGNPIPAGVAVYITQAEDITAPFTGGQSERYLTNEYGKVYIPVDPENSSTSTADDWVIGLPINVLVYTQIEEGHPQGTYIMYTTNWKLNPACTRTIPITHIMA